MGIFKQTPLPTAQLGPAPATSVPTEDPEVTALRVAEQKQAQADKLRATQTQLTTETSLRSNRFGTRSLLGTFGGGSLRSLLGSS